MLAARTFLLTRYGAERKVHTLTALIGAAARAQDIHRRQTGITLQTLALA